MVKMKSLLSKKCFCGFLIILLECFKHLYAIDQPYKYENPKLQNIHRSMKKRDLSRIFAIEDSNDVPDYHIVVPFQLDLYSSIGRNKRELSDKEPIHFTFGISAYDIDFKFNLSLNKHLLGPNFKIEIKGKNGTIEKKAKNCYYSGKVNGNDESVAGISTCNGLSGIFKYNNHDYFIDPVPKYLHKFHQSKNKVLNTKVKSKKSPSKHSADLKYFQPHIIYRRSLNGVYEDHQTLSETFSRFMHKNMMKQCATKGDPLVRVDRSSDDSANFVKSDNTERYIETLVVVDQKMVNYHGEDAATQFALVVLNIVSSLLRDGSIGSNLIILVVVKLELHTVDIPGLVINHHARNTLESFGTWAARASDQDDRSDDHFDYAVLMTRYNVCADDRQPCDILGLTQVGGMCNWPYSASINEDNGLPLAYTITHNIGHSLGMNHDGDESSFICPDNTFLMSSLSTPIQEWKSSHSLWSRCSRNYLKNFLKKDQAKCLLDPPVKAKSVDYEKMDNKPGLLYDLHKQCEMQFGTGSKLCHQNDMEKICSKLQCTNPANPDKCFTSSYPAADGTTCSLSKFCYRGECVSAGDVKAIDGGWSSWSDEFSACSRSCGGGVQYRHRQCSHPKPSNGGKYCEGEARMYRLCSKKPCDTGLKSHRSVQCASLDGRLFGERKFEWEFKPSKIESCKLGCFIAGTGHGYDFGNVEDGTNCDQMDSSVVADKCINGECITVGCDSVLGSKAKFDRCGVCNGDGSSCATGTDRSDIPEISTGSGGIAEALKSLKEMGFDMGSFYSKSQLSLAEKRSDIPQKDDTNFGWSRIKSGCSTSCGGGVETVTPECRRLDDGSPSNEDRCDKKTKPPVQQYSCKEDACPPIWQTSYWGDCSKTCNGGLKKRNVRCVQRAGNGIEYDVDNSLCSGVKPSDTEGCNKESCPSEWVAQPFGECSTICGPGVQVRDVLCQKSLKDGSIVTQKLTDCRKETKPPTEQKCNVHNPCPGDAGCGGIYTDSHGNFSSPEYPNNYPNNMECVHIIQVEEGKVIHLDFEVMKIVAPDDKECKNDFVKVMDGDCVSRLGESKFCGKTLPPPFVSTTNRLCIKFYSDDSQNDEGFIAKYKAIDKPAQNTDLCGYNYTAPAGLISSPNYPEYYPPNEDCNITIITEEKPIRITFHAFDVGTEDCSSDYIFLSGGDEKKKYCGQKVPPLYTSTDNTLFIRFVSSSHLTAMKPGFVATYTSGNPPDKTSDSRHQIPDKSSDISNQNIDKVSITEGVVLPSENNAIKNESNKIPEAKEAQMTLKEVQNTIEEASEERKSMIYPSPDASTATSSTPVSSYLTSDQYAPLNSAHESQASLQPNNIPFTFSSSSSNDEISKEIMPNDNKQELSLVKKQKLSSIPIEEDTLSWIPEPDDSYRFATRTSKDIQVNQVESPVTPVYVSSLDKKSSLLNQEKGFSKKSQYPNPIIPRPQFILKANQHHEDVKKSVISRGLQNYEHNLDGKNGECPHPSQLRCIRLLLSYPCNTDENCGFGFACCTTSCEFSMRMCTPKVTRSCPLRDPFYYPQIQCISELDCPDNGPCCLDMSKKRYCRRSLPEPKDNFID
ncbi:A disintegrin and metalloproteinase with thrombospondin motifs 6 isoform X1 [Hydra vulgaris]|uniref:A disintegrin and metalloproteinase with thrombospondin motifs 6 isoform X1 n=2 Tax=Hydra vulgaris TaxID=6087 RepID=UPI001F5F85B4|nr:A disintegrin and metalloproteinase with thrombospondin motifs 6 isoform X1 [Hydra vulgaris]